jgi:hypothetical protein
MKQKSDDLEQLKLQEAALERQLNELRERRIVLERGLSPRINEGTRPLRDLVLDMLQEAATPLNSLLLASIIRPLFGRAIPSTRFGTLSKDEVKSYASSRARPVYLCHCLTHEHGQAVKRFWARSDWPLSERVMGPMSGRILFLRGAAWTVTIAKQVDEGERAADNPEILKFIAADQARDAGLSVKRGDFPFEEWQVLIAAALERHVAEDYAIREAGAQFLEQHLDDRELLFGSQKGLVSLPGSRSTWRSERE